MSQSYVISNILFIWNIHDSPKLIIFVKISNSKSGSNNGTELTEQNLQTKPDQILSIAFYFFRIPNDAFAWPEFRNIEYCNNNNNELVAVHKPILPPASVDYCPAVFI